MSEIELLVRLHTIYYRFAKENCKNNQTFAIFAGQGLKSYKFEKSNKLEMKIVELMSKIFPLCILSYL